MSQTTNPLAAGFAARFERVRERTNAIFALINPAADELRPIPLRHPPIFYYGHLDAFIVNTLFKQPQDPEFDALFARGIDPGDQAAAAAAGRSSWPSRERIAAYREAVQRRLHDHLANATDLGDGHVYFILLEHELMHQETLLYLIHQLPAELKNAPAGYTIEAPGRAGPLGGRVAIPAGTTWLGVPPGYNGFAWDNEKDGHEVAVPAFEIDATNVTNQQYREFVQAGGPAPFFWTEDGRFKGLFGPKPLDPDAPVLCTQAQALAYARWRDADLPTEAEWQRAAYGDDPQRRFPWGSEPPGPQHGNFGMQQTGPVPVGSYPAGDSPFGVADLLGNGWEWTRTPFAPYDGFQADPDYPGYSADFFDGRHMVLRGASWATDTQLLRRSFRNWFYPDYPYAYATFRTVKRR